MFKMLKNNKGFLNLNFGGGSSKSQQATPQFVQAPDYKESEGARQAWWSKLQEFGGQPGYGAIQPDWGNIWENAQRKVRQYFWGSPTDPGIVGKVKASAARRGVSESPALEKMIGRMGATEANVLSDVATQQATQQAQLAEKGRSDYLQNLMSLANMNPQGTFFSPWSTSKKTNWGVNAESGDVKDILTTIFK